MCLGCCAERNEIKMLNNVEKLRYNHHDNYNTRPASRMPAPEVRTVEHDCDSVIHFLLANCKHA